MTQISRDDKAIAAGLVAIAMSQGGGRDFIEKLDEEAERLFRMLDDSDSHREDYTGVLLAMGKSYGL